MSNLFETGSETVNRMCRLQFTGNVIPSTWYHTIKKETGKPNLNAIIILADIVYWYRPMEIRDEATGQLCGFKKKFQADILQRNYQQLADQFGITKRDAVNAIVDKGISDSQHQRATLLQCHVPKSGCRCINSINLSGNVGKCIHRDTRYPLSLIWGTAPTEKSDRGH